jgi:hypothetical protein
MSKSTFEINQELKDILYLLMIEWIELNYQEAKQIQQTKFETYPPYKNEFKEPCDFYRDLIQILFVSFSYNEKLVDFIIKKEKIKDCHKIEILQYIIGFYKKTYNVRYIDDVLDWKQFNNLPYLLYHLMRVYVKNPNIEEMLFRILKCLA